MANLVGTPYLDITKYDVITQLALQFESGCRMHKELKSSNMQAGNKPKAFTKATPESNATFQLLSVNSRILHRMENYHKKLKITVKSTISACSTVEIIKLISVKD
ncbi:hypothetical protein K3495_g2218 [Podosphaera aphanis]|nr:hypothetical protein K3495_g2218 [Podosphaera aphanis]